MLLQVRTVAVVLVGTRKGNKGRMMGNFRSTTHSLGTTALGGLVSILGSCLSLGSLFCELLWYELPELFSCKLHLLV